MGLLDFLKGKGNKNVGSSAKEQPKSIYTMSIEGTEEEIQLFGIQHVGTVADSNNNQTQLMMAKAIKHESRYGAFGGNLDYVAFEIGERTEITDEMIQVIMQEYERQQGQMSVDRQQVYYFGRVQEYKGNYSIEEQPKETKETVIPLLNEIIQKSMPKKEGDLRGRVDVRQHLKQMADDREARKQNPALKRRILPKYEGKNLENYDGVNLDTGDIMRLRKVHKIGKDGSGTYLYSAYLDCVANNDIGEQLYEEPVGCAVCFELEKKLEDIAKGNDMLEIRKVLELFSASENFKAPEVLRYIGKLDSNGNISRNVTSTSRAIRTRIESMQREFIEAHVIQQQANDYQQ